MKKWYYLQDEIQKGPFDYRDMIELMQKHELFEYHFIWTPGMEAWCMLAEVPDFSRDRLALMIETNGQGADAFFKRDSERLPVQIPVYAHNNESFLQGECTNLSKNGALVTLNSPFILPSQELVIHFTESAYNDKSFKVQAVVIRKHVNKKVLHIRSGLQYAIRFTKIQNLGEKLISNLVLHQQR